MPTVVTSSALRALESELIERVKVVKATDPLAPVTVVVGSNLQHIYLRRCLARELGAVANVRFFTLLDLAGEIHLAAEGSEDSPALPEGGEALVIRTILEDAGRDGKAVPFPAGTSGLPEAIAATIRDLREGMIGPEHLANAEIPDHKRDGLAAVYASFKERTGGFLDRTAMLESAAASGALPPELTLAPVLMYGIHDLNELQLMMILRVAAAATDFTAFVLGGEERSSLAFSADLVKGLTHAGFEHFVLPPPAEEHVSAETILFSSVDRQSEAEEVTRRVLTDLEDGVPPGDIAIVHRLDQGHDEVIGGVLDRAGIPYYLASGVPVRRTAAGKAALNLLRLLCDEPRRGALLEFLSLPCTSLDWIEDGLFPRSRSWEWVSKELGLVKGWDEFQTLLEFSLANAEADPDDWRAGAQKEAAETLLPVVNALAAESAMAEKTEGWGPFCEWFSSLLEKTVRAADRELDARDAVIDRLDRLAVLDAARVPCDRTLFAAAAEKAIRGTTLSGGYFQRDGVFLGNVVSARGLRFRRVYLMECAERTFPPVMRQDPLLLDAEREAVNRGASGTLPLKRRRLDEERMLFEMIRQAPDKRLTVSYARRANLSGTPRLPSSLMLELAAERSGAFKSIEEIEKGGHDWFARLPSRVGFEADPPDGSFRALDGSDLRFHALEQSGRGALAHVQAIWPGLDRLRALRKARRERSFTEFDGVLPPDLVAKARVLERNLSASSMAAYAECPYRFFLSKVLGLSALSEPEETLEIGAAPRGSFIHRILERFVERYLEEGKGDWEAYLRSGAKIIAEITEAEVAALPTGVRGLPVSWQIAREEIEQDLKDYIEDELQHLEEGWRPIATEKKFEDVALDAGPFKVTVTGAIDRLDRNEAGALRVVDYKTGRAWEKGDGYRRGGSLQLPVYLNAACHDEKVPLAGSRAEYHYATRRGGFTRPGLDGDDLLADNRFGQVVEAMAEGINSGAFFYWPAGGRQNCRLCDFYDVCDSRVEFMQIEKAPGSAKLRESFERIRNDPGPS